MTGIQLDQRGYLLFPADDRARAPTWVSAQTFLPLSGRNIEK